MEHRCCDQAIVLKIAHKKTGAHLDFGQVLLQLGVSPEGLHRALSKKLARTLTAADDGAA
jgi:hypothetical protein